MIKSNIKEIKKFIYDVIHGELPLSSIKSLRIDKRKPHTDRLFFMLPSDSTLRICLHTFQRCEVDEAFPHPHSWESEVLLLEGLYKHSVAVAHHVDYEPYDTDYFTQTLSTNSTYSIDCPYIWHKVQPLTQCRTIMINGPTWDESIRSKHCKFTKGKELVELSDTEKLQQLNIFYNLIGEVV